MKKKDIFFILSFAIISFLVFLPQYVSDKIIGWLDMIYYFIPFKEIIAENIKNGIMPLWNPYIYCGQPLLANFQSAVFYPLNIFYYAFPIDTAFKINTFIIYFIMSVSAYLLFRQMDLTEEAAFISSFLFSFTAYMTIRAAEWADLHTIAWMPAAIYFSKLSLNSNRKIDDFLTIIALTMSLLAGHPQVFIYMFLLFSFLYFYWAGFKGYKKYLIYVFFLFLISAVQILPTMEFINFSSRTSKYKMFYDLHSNMYMHFGHLIQIFFPFVKKFFSEGSIFINWMALIDIGIISLLLGGFAIVKMKDVKLRNFLLVLFTVSLFFSFLNSMPFYKNVYNKLFFLHFIRYPAKINVIFFFVLCFFAGMGFDLLFNTDNKNKYRFLWCVIILNIVFIFIYVFLYYDKLNIIKFYIKHFAPESDLSKIIASVRNYDVFLNEASKYLIMLFLFMAVLYFIIQRDKNNLVVKVMLIALIIINVYVFNKPNYGNYVKYDNFNGETRISKFLKSRNDINNKRILAPLMTMNYSNIMKKKHITVDEKYDYIRSKLQPNVPMFYRFYNMDGFDSLIIASIYDFVIQINKYKAPWDNSMFSLFSTKYIVAISEIHGKTIKKVFFDDVHNMYLYEKKDVPDVVYFVPLKYAIYVNNDDEKFNELYNKQYEYDKKITIDVKYKDKFNKYKDKKSEEKKAKISFKRNGLNNLCVDINNSVNGFLVVSENFYPGWIVKVNGVKKEIIKVNGFLKGIFVEQGKNVVELQYKPVILFIGYVMSLTAFLILFIIFFRRKNEKK